MDNLTDDQKADRIRMATIGYVPSPTNSRQWNSQLRWTILTEQVVKACEKHGLTFEAYMKIMDQRADAKMKEARAATH